MPDYTGKQDAFGHLLQDYLTGGKMAVAIVERDDGLIDHGGDTGVYFAEFRKWPRFEKHSMRLVRGRVLDIGCGAGRVLLYLESVGFECVGIDNSPLAVKVCRIRGARDVRRLPLTQITPAMGPFDTVIMYGNNFGLVGNPRTARWWLRKMLGVVSKRGRILAECLDPCQTALPEHREYHRLNRKRGRMGGQVRIRVRYHKYSTPWWDLLLLSKKEMAGLIKDTGWKIDQFIDAGSPMFVAVLVKE